MWLLGRTLAQLEGEALSSNPEPEEKLKWDKILIGAPSRLRC